MSARFTIGFSKIPNRRITPGFFYRTRQRPRIFPPAERFYVLPGRATPPFLKPRTHAIRTIMCGLWAGQRFAVAEIDDESGKFGTQDEIGRASCRERV